MTQDTIIIPKDAAPAEFFAAITAADAAIDTAEAIDGGIAAVIAPEAFAIDSLDRLAWYGRKLSGIDDEIRHIQENAAELCRALEADRKGLQDRFGVQAENCAMDILRATKAKTKTLKTLGGSFSFRIVPGGVRKADAALVLDWAKASAPELVKRTEIVKEDVPADAIKTHWQTTGEIPPGCELVPDRQTFSHRQEA